MIARRGVLKLFGVGVLGLIATAAYPFIEALARPRITTYALTPRGWPAGLKLRAAVIADLHACEPWMDLQRIEALCAQTQDLGVDIILLLGDYVSGMRLRTGQVANVEWASALGKLSAPLGVHAVLGNHDYWEDLAFQLDHSATPLARTALHDAGIATYVNQAIRLEKDGHGFWLAGLGDQMGILPGGAHDGRHTSGLDDLDGTLAQIPTGEPTLLLAHEPDIFPGVPDRVSLTLSGHTHGGQISLFGWRPWAASLGSRRFPAGHYTIEGRELIVSRGLGCSVIPVRIGNWPEIVVLDLGKA
ncbi:MAG: metallophosphoesterase [Hyphomicrobiales bacterium]|nr:MAG: metallophosphoesterase [Hyphomicrobiales bacterium]